MLPVFSSAASVDCSARSYLFSFAIAQLAVHKNCFKMWQKKQNKTKQKEKKNTIFWNLKTIDPSNFEVNQIEGAKIIFKRAFQASSVSTLTVLNNSLYLLSQEIFRKSCRLKIPSCHLSLRNSFEIESDHSVT